jgi:hypothetical protein
MKICLVASELFLAGRHTDGRTDRQTDVSKLIVTFRNLQTGLILNCTVLSYGANGDIFRHQQIYVIIRQCTMGLILYLIVIHFTATVTLTALYLGLSLVP